MQKRYFPKQVIAVSYGKNEKLENLLPSAVLRDRLEITDTLPEEENDSDLENFSLEKCISYFQTIPKTE